MIRRSIRLTCMTLAALCLYLPHAGGARAQQGNQAKPAASATAAAGAQAGAQASGISQPLEIRGSASENVVDGSLKEDPELRKIIAPYKTKVDELNTPIGKLAGDLKKTGVGGGSLGNFVSDALRSIAEKRLGKPVLLSIINTSGLRKNSIAAGDISTTDIFELLPFENALVTLELTGEQLRSFMDVNVQRNNAQSGARIVYRNNAEKKQNEIVSIRLGSDGAERDIDPNATYTITTIDYLVKRGGEYSVLKEGKNLRPLNITMRDALIEYVKAETAAGRPIKASMDGRFKDDGSGGGRAKGDER
ncbi:MAG TPA: 5'-nucleotidase C-terminal domain-containing protein [Pyrinomonadaceae bacterium]|nr:5'-nucleotidase C-terminal domain-containing protein [Pyrinomonadaceae bacterium]